MDMKSTNPILLSIPERFESERLIIRAPLLDDGPLVNAAVQASIDELRPWMPWARTVPTEEQSEVISRQGRIHYLERSDLRMYVIHKETGAFIGSSGLHRIDWQARKFEIGYWMNTPHSGQGYMTEAVDRITAFAIQELQANRIEIRVDSRNERSLRVAERLGFTLEGTLRNDKCDVYGMLSDTRIYAKVRGMEYR
ncbi:N-acetyltransferase [Paenibacillus sp. 1011MAR3C5]|uniref:GNAT family N-acetyltransferase n=1 Tax=Paenibacillus sp. 1011MAR3C5 TaxID=1675787 RepID=UPI000E6C3291|nr:GNAT family protein [Paenibacillus sp. 1011MAR3C5]RJE88451.1 N-acetyltransferase [Paenibacillus sp. 1011MAR3C5]